MWPTLALAMLRQHGFGMPDSHRVHGGDVVHLLLHEGFALVVVVDFCIVKIKGYTVCLSQLCMG